MRPFQRQGSADSITVLGQPQPFIRMTTTAITAFEAFVIAPESCLRLVVQPADSTVDPDSMLVLN